MDRARVLDRNQRVIERIDDQAVRDVVRIYETARKELFARLLDSWSATEPSRGQAAAQLQTLGILGEIDSRIAQLEAEAGEVLRGVMIAQDEVALNAMRREIGVLEKLAGIDTPRLSSVEFALIEQHLPMVTDSLTFWSQSVRLKLRQELQNGLIQGESFEKLIARVMAQEGKGSIWARGRVSAELMVRRTVISANNAAKQAYIAQVVPQVPRVRKQAVAVIAGNTTKCCLAVHGQIRKVDEPFTLTETPRYSDQMQHSPFHWKCRTSIAMYHPVFESAGGLTTESMTRTAEKELRSR